MACQHPEKTGRYPSERVAKIALRKIKNPQGTMHAFPCPCGFWHFGHGDALTRRTAQPGRTRDARRGPAGRRERGGGNRRRYDTRVVL